MTTPKTQERTPPARTTYLGADTEGRPGNASWGAVLAGVAVVLAVLITFALVGSALGLGIADPTSDDPMAGVGVAVGLWSLLTLAVALAAGGFVTGALAVRAGFLHGLVVWATSTIALLVAVVMAVSGVLGAAGSLVGSVASTIGSGAGTLADVAGDAVGAVAEGVADELEVDTSGLTDDVQQVLVDTGVPELQPEYLQSQLEEARDEVGEAATELVTDPGRYEEILSALATSLQERVETIAESVDRDAIASAVEANTELSEEEATEAVDNAYTWAQTATDEARQAIDQAEQALADAQEEVSQLVEDARQTLDEASDAAAQAALWAFAGLVIGAAITAFAGVLGSRQVAARTESGRVRAPGERADTA